MTKDTKISLILDLYDKGMVKFGNFKFKLHDRFPDAPLAPFYIDLRMLRRFPDVKRKAIDIYIELLNGLSFDLLADVPTAGTPLVSSISDKLKVGMITPRADKKTHGSGAKIDGVLESDKGKTVVLIDDLVTQADSKFEAAQTLIDCGIKIKDIVVLIDRQQGGSEQLAKKGFTLHSAYTLHQMFEIYKSEKRIKEDLYQDSMKRLEELNKFLETAS